MDLSLKKYLISVLQHFSTCRSVKLADKYFHGHIAGLNLEGLRSPKLGISLICFAASCCCTRMWCGGEVCNLCQQNAEIFLSKRKHFLEETVIRVLISVKEIVGVRSKILSQFLTDLSLKEASNLSIATLLNLPIREIGR
ncbi:hypothetical protein CEXT_9631 [Caerostris extrusa]|uniref:Uncharacterized protein n=1 Tax=Caerostris extrusa TaxID=172846 RepID=A0AAV4YBS7_CAEEX|nr:hypothetical protein CEXT_9631 [Caerostris extrusa]